MPILEYQCEQCGKSFDFLSRNTRDKAQACPHCQSTRLTRKLSVFAAPSSASRDDSCGEGPCEMGPCSQGDACCQMN